MGIPEKAADAGDKFGAASREFAGWLTGDQSEIDAGREEQDRIEARSDPADDADAAEIPNDAAPNRPSSHNASEEADGPTVSD